MSGLDNVGSNVLCQILLYAFLQVGMVGCLKAFISISQCPVRYRMKVSLKRFASIVAGQSLRVSANWLPCVSPLTHYVYMTLKTTHVHLNVLVQV